MFIFYDDIYNIMDTSMITELKEMLQGSIPKQILNCIYKTGNEQSEDLYNDGKIKLTQDSIKIIL